MWIDDNGMTSGGAGNTGVLDSDRVMQIDDNSMTLGRTSNRANEFDEISSKRA